MIANLTGRATVRTTGRPYRQTYIGIFHAANGKAVLFHEYFDTLELSLARAQAELVE